LFVLSHGVARTSGKRPKSILIIRKGVLIMFYPLYAVRYTLYEMIHAHKPLFAKQGKVLNLGHLYFDIVSNFVLRISYFATNPISPQSKSLLQQSSGPCPRTRRKKSFPAPANLPEMSKEVGIRSILLPAGNTKKLTIDKRVNMRENQMEL